jgi:cytochrome c oxidase cbb3-type subunit 3
MPPLLAALGEDSVAGLARYVLALGNGTAAETEHDAARTQFTALCGACHGADATGNPLLGAPDLTAGVWTYGGGFDQIYESIAGGRTGQMPAFSARLDDTEIRLLGAWLRAGQANAE